MKLVIIRHGDPDYIHDSLTEQGEKEAQLLSERISRMHVDAFYQSPLGRAQKTASYTLEKMGREAETMEWLKEFDPRIIRPDHHIHKTCVWDWKPEDWTKDSRFYEYDHWFEHPLMVKGNVKERYDWVTSNFDALLEKHGYVHEGKVFKVTNSNHDTIVLFCHFGLECVLISHLLHVSPMPLWHGFVCAPTGVTIIHTEERNKGTASFRIAQFGDISHLYVAGEEPSFAARYCECYEDDDLH